MALMQLYWEFSSLSQVQVQHYAVNADIEADARNSQTGLTQHAPKRISLHVSHVLSFFCSETKYVARLCLQDLQLGQHLPERLAQRPTTVSVHHQSNTQVPNQFSR